jgi:hypothetical protein
MNIQLACKEWASVCAALASGRQSILLRKGGIAEPTGDFQVQSNWFWLYPTYVHQQQNQLRETEWLEKCEIFKAQPKKIRFFHLAEVVETYHLMNLDILEKLEPFHVLSKECISSRFAYRNPGLTLMLLKTHEISKPVEIDETPFYLGCKSWVNLESPLDASAISPVLSSDKCSAELEKIKALIKG